jgi:hypothetical protein
MLSQGRLTDEEIARQFGAAAEEAEQEGDFRRALSLYARAILLLAGTTQEVHVECPEILHCD